MPFHSLSECETGVDTHLDPFLTLIMEMIAESACYKHCHPGQF